MKSFSPAELNFSDKAIDHFSSSLKARGKGLGVQIGVKKAGCSGYEYFFNFIDNIEEEFVTFETDGCNVFVDRQSLEFLKGSLVDFSEDGLNKGIKFINPNAKAVCGCGESFTV